MDEQALNELLECSVCLERLDHTSKVLPCQHTFCRRCLDEIVCTKKELRCPECRTLVSYRVEDLPANILLIRLLEGLKHANNQIVSSSSSTGAFKAKPPSRRHESLNTNLSHTSASKRQFDAKALYNYDAKEPGDLSFKKGEIITVCRQIDPNWYYGELNGQDGYFPSSYVQVVSTFSSSVPQVKALYDFDIKDENEKDCLKFQKDEILQLIRKVDDNWLEGRRGDKIGIFPLSFVELNDAAKSLVASRSRSSSSSSSVGVCDGVPSGTSSSSSNNSRSSAPPPGVRLPSSSFQQIWHPLPQQRDRVALHPPTPNTAAANAAASLPPSPLNASTSAQQKRHSFTATSHTHSANSSPTVQQRRSLELSPTSGTMPPTSPLHVALPPPPAPSCSSNVGSASAMKLLAHLESSGQIADDNKPGSTEANPPDIPFGKTAIYSALYNYKPQKEDEVELRKGDYYTVTEKCQDGWYKGHCLKTGVNGVFPGNYVQISRQSVGFVPVNPNLRGKELPSSSSIASADISSPPGSVFYGSPPPPPCSGNMDTPPPAPPPATVSQPHIRAVGSSSSSHGTSNSSTNLHRPSASGTTARSRALHHGSSVSSTSSSILASAYHSNNNNSCSGSSGNTGVGSGSALSPSVSSSILAAAYSNNNNNNNSSVGVISGSNLSTSVSSSSSQLSSSSTTHAIVDTPGSKSHSGPGGNTSASSLKNTASMGGCGVAGGHHAQNLNPSSSSSSHRNVADFAALQHSMSASANITPPNVVAGISSTATSHSTSKEKKEKKDKDKPSLVKRLTMGKGKKSKSPSEGEDPVVTLSSDTSHTTGHTSEKKSCLHPDNTRYRCIAPYPPQGEMELELKTGDIVLVYKKWEDGWFKGALQRTGKNGLFPGSFVTKCD